jgi:hypothetical protein
VKSMTQRILLKQQAPKTAREWRAKYEALVKALEETTGPQILAVILRRAEHNRQ